MHCGCWNVQVLLWQGNLKIENLGPEKDQWDHPLKGTLSRKNISLNKNIRFLKGAKQGMTAD